MKRLSFALILAVIVAACTTTMSDQLSGDLETGVPVEGELAVEQPDTFNLHIAASTYLYGVVDQVTVDVVVTLYDSTWNMVTRFDGPARGIETFYAEVDEAGPYYLEVAPFEKESGHYVVEIFKAEPVATEPRARADQLFTPFTGDDVPGGVAGVYRDGQVIFSEAYGMADLTFAIPFSNFTPSNIGSVSKQFTAMAILLLEQQGELSLDDDIRKHFPELPDLGKVVTIRNLLNHTNGLREVYNLMPLTGWKGEDVLRREQVIELLKNQEALQNDPGEEYNYNNSAFILCALLVEKVTGQKFPAWMEENVFGPLEMASSVVRDNPKAIIPGASRGYQTDSLGYREAGDLYAAYGAGGIYTTVADFSRWLNNFTEPVVGDADLIARMVTPDTLNNGDTLTYGYGIGVDEFRGLKVWSHGGADIAHRAYLAYFPEINAGVATLSNHSGFPSYRIAMDLAEAFFGDEMEKEEEGEEGDSTATDEVVVPERLLKAYEGKYRVANMGVVAEYTLEDGVLIFSTEGQPDGKMIPESDSVFAYEGVEASVTFTLGPDGKVLRAVHSQGGGKYVLTPMEPYKPLPEELAEFEGRYFSEEIQTFYTLALHDSTLEVSLMNTEPIGLSPLEEDLFKGEVFFISELKFNRDESGTVSGFAVSNGRTRGVQFDKQD